MKMSDVTRKATVEMGVTGYAETTAKIDGFASSLKVATKEGELFTRQEGLKEQSLTRSASKLEAATRSNDAVSRSAANLARMEGLVAQERSKGAPITDANIRALENLRIKHQAAQEALARSGIAVNDNTQSYIRNSTALRDNIEILGRVRSEAGAAQQTARRADDIAAYGVELDRVRAKISPLFAAEQQHLSALHEINQAARVGAVNERERAEAIARTTAAFSAQISKMHAAGIATSGATTFGAGEIIASRNRQAAQGTINSRLGVRSDFGAEQRRDDVEAAFASRDAIRAQYDKLFDAQQKYRAELGGLSSALKTGAIDQDIYAKNLAEIKSAFAAQIIAMKPVKAEIDSLASGMSFAGAKYLDMVGLMGRFDAAARASAAAAKVKAESIDSLVTGMSLAGAKYRDMTGLMGSFATVAREAEAAAKLKAETVDRLVIGMSLAGAKYRDMTGLMSQFGGIASSSGKGIDGLTEAQRKHLGVTRLQRFELINLSRQAQDVFVSLAAGQNPLLVAIQQGSQIADVFGSSKAGFGAALKQTGAIVLGFATHPLTLLATTLGVVSVSAFKFAEQQNALERSLNGVGRAAGVSRDRLRELGESGARQGGFGVGQGAALAGKFAGAGIAGSNIGPLVADTQKFARAFGLDMEKAGDEIAQIVSEQGLGAFEKRFGAVSFATKATVTSLEASGRFIDAQTEKTRLFKEETEKARDTSSELANLWEEIVKFATTPILPIGKAALGAKTSLEEQLRAAQSPGSLSAYERRLGINQDQSEITRLQRALKEKTDAAAKLDLDKRSQRAGAIVDELNPDASRLRGLKQQLDALEPLTKTAEGMKALGDRAGDAEATVARLRFGIEHFQTAAEKMREDSALAVREIQARTFAEREAVAVERARIQATRELKSETEILIAKEGERTKLLAESARKIDDRARSVSDQLELSKLKPGDRAVRELEFAQRDFREQNIPTRFEAVGNAASNLADVLTESATRIETGKNALPVFASGQVGSGAADLLRKFEGFQGRAKLDVNAFRAGFGSDTVTRENGAVEKISRDSVVSRADAERDLARRLREFEGVISKQIGSKAFEGLSPRARAALDSVAYNYGSLPKRLVPAARSGDDAAIAQGIRGLAGDNGGVNRRRRNQEADSILGGAANNNLATGAGRQNSKIDAIDAAERRTLDENRILGPLRAGNEELALQSRLLDVRVATFDKSTREIVEATTRQELLNKAILDHNKFLPGEIELIEQRAVAAGKQADADEKVKEAQDRIIASMDAVRSVSRDALGGLIGDLRQGVSASDALGNALQRVADSIIQSQLNSLIDGIFGKAGKAGGGLFGNFISGLFPSFDAGGVIGAGGGKMVSAPLSAFIGAPSFEKGGSLGIPMFGHPGEIVLNAAMQRNTADAVQRGAFRAASTNDNRPDDRVISSIFAAARQSSSPQASFPKITMINNAAGVTVTPQITHGEIMFIVSSALSANNDQRDKTMLSRMQIESRR